MTHPPDMRHTILDTVHHQLSVDEAWTVRHEDGFTWWPGGGVQQHVRVEGPILVAGVDTWWLAIETPVWRAPDDGALARLQRAIERLRVRTHGAAVVVDPEQRGVSLVMRTYLLPEVVPGRCFALAGLGAVQARQALAAWAHAESTIGRRAVAWRDALPHPIGGERRIDDEILSLPEGLIKPMAERLGTTGLLDAWRQTADALQGYGLDGPAEQADTMLVFATRVGERDAVVVLGLMQDDLNGPAVAVSTLVPASADPTDARALCDALQRAALTPPSLVWTLGSWVVRENVWDTDGLTAMHTAFLPIGLFPAGYALPLAHAVTEQVRVCGRMLDARPTPSSVTVPSRHADALTPKRPPERRKAS